LLLDNQLVLFADDVNPRFLTCGCLLDYDTVAGADKFGNVFFLRLPNDAKDDVDEDPTGVKALWDRGLLNGASQKVFTQSRVIPRLPFNSFSICRRCHSPIPSFH